MDAKITPEELKAKLQDDFDGLVEKVCRAVNTARPGRIIAESEEPVRDANAEFRERVYQKAINLLDGSQEAFSPSEDPGEPEVEEQGQAEHLVHDRQRAPDA